MATATLTDGPAVQLTFPWALPKAEEEATIVAERRTRSAARTAAGRAARRSPAAAQLRITVQRHVTAKTPSVTAEPSSIEASSIAPSVIEPSVMAESTFAAPPQPVVAATGCSAVDSTEPFATSVQEALCGDRIGKPVRMGAVMFRLLKRYGITDEEIAEGIAAYHAKRAARA